MYDGGLDTMSRSVESYIDKLMIRRNESVPLKNFVTNKNG